MIKKFITGISLMAATSISATVYNSMEFTTADGSSHSIGTQGLVMTLSGEKLLITNDAGQNLELPLSSLVSMQFGGDESKISETVSSVDGSVTIFSTAGVEIGRYPSVDDARASLAAGIYIIKDLKGNTIKLLIEK